MAFQMMLPSSLGIPTPVEIQGYVEDYDPGEEPSEIDRLLGEEQQADEAIAWDVVEPTGGLAEAYDPDGEPVVDKPHVLKTMVEDTMYWAIKLKLTQKDILRARRPGTLDIDGEHLAMNLVNKAILMLQRRKQQQKWATILGQNVIDSNGVKRTIDYTSMLAGTPTASTPWSTVASADPMYNLQVWEELFDEKTDGDISLHINPKTLKYLSQNAKLRDLVKQSGQVVRLGNGNVSQLIIELSGSRIKRIVVERGRYRDRSGTLHWFLPEGKGVMIAETPKGQPLGAFRSTPSTYRGGLRPQAGMFSIVDDQLAKRGFWSVMVGQHGLPVLYLPGCIAVATLYTP